MEWWTVKEYDIFFPLYYNDGSAVETKKIRVLQARLLEQFNGLTFFPQPNEGFWKMAGVTYRDEVVIFRVLTSKEAAARRFFTHLKAELQRQLRQEQILIIERDVRTL